MESMCNTEEARIETGNLGNCNLDQHVVFCALDGGSDGCSLNSIKSLKKEDLLFKKMASDENLLAEIAAVERDMAV